LKVENIGELKEKDLDQDKEEFMVQLSTGKDLQEEEANHKA
jgi:hypothetical protein